MYERRAPIAGRLLSRRGFLAVSAAGAGILAGCTGTPDASQEGELRPAQTLLDDPAPERSEVTILMIGDVLVHEGVWRSGEREDGTRDYEHLFAHVADLVAEADVAIVDQETILGGTGLGLSSYPTFNSPQEIGSAEAVAGFDVVLHANNHALDKGMEGIEAELAFWRSEHPEVAVTGMADSEEAAGEIPLLERGDRRIAVLSYTYGTNGIPLPTDAPWAVRMLDDAQVEKDFSLAWERGADAVVVCPHWGTEYAAGPDDGQRRWAERFVELGADVIRRLLVAGHAARHASGIGDRLHHLPARRLHRGARGGQPHPHRVRADGLLAPVVRRLLRRASRRRLPGLTPSAPGRGPDSAASAGYSTRRTASCQPARRASTRAGSIVRRKTSSASRRPRSSSVPPQKPV